MCVAHTFDFNHTLRLNSLPHAGVLRNIALYHHEAVDGSGYIGLKGNEIPIEARIVSVADVFDALTSPRSYKKALGNDQAFEYLHSMAGSKFDLGCVSALIKCRHEVENIQNRFNENSIA